MIESPLRPIVGPLLRGLFDRPRVTGGAPVDPDLTTYVAAVTSAGGTLTSPQQQAVNAFIVSTKAAGVWGKLTELGLFLGGTLSSAAVKVKTAGPANCTLNGFVLGDLTSAGLVGDGSTKWVNTGTTVTQASATGPMGVGVYLTSEVTQPGFAMIAGTNASGGPQLTLRWQAETNGVDTHVNGDGATTAVATKARAKILKGLIATSRVGNTLSLFNGGMPMARVTSTFSYTASATPIAILSGNSGGNPIAATTGGYYFENGTLSDAEHRALAQAFNALMASLGRMPADARPFNYVLSIGQSLAVGTNGTPVVSTTQPYLNLVNDAGVTQGNVGDSTTMLYWTSNGLGQQAATVTPLVEFVRETHASGMLNTVSQKARAGGYGSAWDAYTTNFGLGATAYADLAKGTSPYRNAIDTAAFAATVQPAYTTGPARAPYIAVVHGETDMLSTTYGADVRQWQADFEADLNAAFGTTGTIPMLHSQPSCWTAPGNNNTAVGVSPYQLLTEYETNPTKTLLVCPKYFLTYSDGVHLGDGAQYRILGDYYGKAAHQHVVQGVQWSPLRPLTVQRTGAVITVTFAGNVGNLQFDTTNVTDPSGGANTKGFEYTDSAGGSVYTRIASVVLQGPNQVVITLTADPGANTGRFLSYAYTGTPGASAGPTTGPRGNLRDSDTFTGQSGTVLPNWCVHFRKAVP